MNKGLFIILFILSWPTLVNVANAGQIQVGFGLVRTDLNSLDFIENEYVGNSDITLGILQRLGYIFDSSIFVDVDLMVTSTFSLFGTFDEVSLFTTSWFVGYKFEKAEFYLSPKVGYANWSATYTEGTFLNPGEELTFKEKGTDFIWSVSLGKSFNHKAGISLSYRNMDLDYTEASSYILNLDFEF